MRTAVLAAILFLLAGNVLADPQPWMVKENPNELVVTVGSSCTAGTEQQYTEIVDDVLTRSRVKSVSGLGLANGEIYLRGVVECSSYSDKYIFSFSLNFAYRNDEDDVVSYPYTGYSHYGVETADEIARLLRDQAENAITDYLIANFDL